jgi:hypothetical protein
MSFSDARDRKDRIFVRDFYVLRKEGPKIHAVTLCLIGGLRADRNRWLLMRDYSILAESEQLPAANKSTDTGSRMQPAWQGERVP